MNVRRFILPVVLLLSGTCWIHAQGFRVHRQLTVDPGEQIAENVMVWRGMAEMRGLIQESLFLIGGEARISGTIKKDVIGFSANIKLEPGTIIEGELLLIGGELTQADSVRIDGGHLHFRYDLSRLQSSLYPVFSTSGSIGFFRAVKIIIWFVITLLTFMLFPRAVVNAESVLSARTWRMGISGITALLAFLAATMLSLFLSFLIIGIPLLFILILAWFAVLVLGRTVVFYAIGRRLTHRLGYTGSSVPLALLTGTFVFAIFKYIPVAGPLVLLLLNLVEIGTGTVYLMRRLRKPSSALPQA